MQSRNCGSATSSSIGESSGLYRLLLRLQLCLPIPPNPPASPVSPYPSFQATRAREATSQTRGVTVARAIRVYVCIHMYVYHLVGKQIRRTGRGATARRRHTGGVAVCPGGAR
jgi:hypothetical protein